MPDKLQPYPNRKEQRIERSRNSEEQDVQSKIDFAFNLLQEMKDGQDFMLPSTPDMLGSVAFWNTIAQGLGEMWGDKHEVVGQVVHIVEVLENGGAVRRSTLDSAKDSINEELVRQQQDQLRAA